MKMKYFGYLAVSTLLAGLPACGNSPSDNGFSMGWQVVDVGTTDVLTCAEAGTDMVSLVTRHLSTGVTQTFSVPCADGGIDTTTLPTGQYSITASLMTPANIVVSSLVIPEPGEAAPVLGRRGFLNLGTVLFEIQSFQTAWTITKAGIPATCASVGATQVQLTATTAKLAPFVFTFPCEVRDRQGVTQAGVTQAVPDGDYSLQFRLLDAAGGVLSELSIPNYSTPMNAPAILDVAPFALN